MKCEEKLSIDAVAVMVEKMGLESAIKYYINSKDIEDEDLSTMWLEAKAVISSIEEYLENYLSQKY